MKKIITIHLGLLASMACMANNMPQQTKYTDSYDNTDLIEVDGILYKPSVSDSNKLQIVGITESVVELNVPESVIIDGIEHAISETMTLHGSPSKTNLKSVNTGHVTQLGYNALKGFSSVESVSLPNVSVLGEGCFQNCTALKECSLPKVDKIHEIIFLNCTSLERLTFEAPQLSYIVPKGMKPSHEGYTYGFFAGCTSLRELILKGGLTECFEDEQQPPVPFYLDYGLLPGDILYGCDNLAYLYINHDMLYVDNAIWDLPGLNSLYLGNNCISYISPGAVTGCDIRDIYCMFPIPPVKLSESGDDSTEPIDVDKQTCTVHVPKGCRDRYMQSPYWSQYANIVEDSEIEPLFDPVLGPKEAIYADPHKMYGYYPTDNEGKLAVGLAYYQFEGMNDGVPTFCNYTFPGNSPLRFNTTENPIVIAGREYFVTEIAPFTSRGYSVESVTIGDGVTRIGDWSFSDCEIAVYDNKILTEKGVVSLPSTLQSIGQHAFENAQNVATVNCYAMTPPALADDRFFTNAEVRGEITLNVPAEAVQAYESAPVWRDFRIVGINGVDNVEAEIADGDVEYYNLQGMRVTPDRAGVYIRRAGGEVTKVMIK